MNEYYVKRSRMTDFLNRFEEDAETITSSVYLPPHLSSNEIRQILPASLPDTIVELAAGSVTGATIFTGSESDTMVLPPFHFHR